MGYAASSTVAINIEERRRRRDQRLVQTANDIVQQAAAQGRTITLEWAAIAVLMAVGAALILAAWYRHLGLLSMGSSAWGGLVMGGLVTHAVLQEGSARFTWLALAVFAGLPLAAIPFRFVSPEPYMLLLLVLCGLGAALFSGALRFAWQIRGTVGTLHESVAATGAGVQQGMAATQAWLREAIVKWVFAAFLLLVGGGLAFVGRMQQQEKLFWAGAALVFLIGSVGLWAPGLGRRTRLAVGLRHCGQVCFWLSFLVVPFVETGPSGSLPYAVQPSWRFAAMGVGLVLVGSTWFLQRGSIFSHHTQRERKRPAERSYSLAIVVLGLLVLVAGVRVRQIMKFSIDQSVISQTEPVSGRVQFQPPSQIRSLEIVQPLPNVPLYWDNVQFEDGTSMALVPLVYPGEQRQPFEHGIVKAVRAAAQLNVQRSIPASRVERWTRTEEPRG